MAFYDTSSPLFLHIAPQATQAGACDSTATIISDTHQPLLSPSLFEYNSDFYSHFQSNFASPAHTSQAFPIIPPRSAFPGLGIHLDSDDTSLFLSTVIEAATILPSYDSTSNRGASLSASIPAVLSSCGLYAITDSASDTAHNSFIYTPLGRTVIERSRSAFDSPIPFATPNLAIRESEKPDIGYSPYSAPQAMNNTAGPFADINMYYEVAEKQEDSICVVPSDTVGLSITSSDFCWDGSETQASKRAIKRSPSSEDLSMVTALASSGVSTTTRLFAFSPSQYLASPLVYEEAAALTNTLSSVVLNHQPSRRPLAEGTWRNRVLPAKPLVIDPRLLQLSLSASADVDPSHIDIHGGNVEGPRVELKVDLDADVVNAHEGVLLEELIIRADDYRKRNPGKDIDKTWLNTFAGKLTADGKRLDVYRCYVSGCARSNKRRDHVLVHLGGHLGERPFACGVCGQRFLRKNECKRHEANHLGARPYACPICDHAYARQDIVVRHLQRTHGVGSSRSKKENVARPRKRVRRSHPHEASGIM